MLPRRNDTSGRRAGGRNVRDVKVRASGHFKLIRSCEELSERAGSRLSDRAWIQPILRPASGPSGRSSECSCGLSGEKALLGLLCAGGSPRLQKPRRGPKLSFKRLRPMQPHVQWLRQILHGMSRSVSSSKNAAAQGIRFSRPVTS